METEIIKAVGELGGTVVLGFLLYKLASNHINHSTAATLENTKALDKLSLKLELSIDKDNRMLDILERLCKNLDK